ncbi:MAG TPA: glutathione S-transferase [Stellaceae bacterium]|nr:glutathione S-transferase [Stellaceae bacterium]
MKLYDYAAAPSPRRVTIFLREKGITVPTAQVDLRAGEQFSPAFRAVNPDCTVPVLELDDGTRITDAIAICRYFEEMQPEPRLMGGSPREKAVIEMHQRQMERDGFYAVMEAFRNATPAFKIRAIPGADDYAQIPELAERGRARVARFMERLDAQLAKSRFVAGETFTIADITAFLTIDFARWVKIAVPETCAALRRWQEAVGQRPSIKG